MIVKFYRWLMAEPSEPTPCLNCDMLRSMLETEKYEKKQLLDTVINFGKPIEEKMVGEIEYKPVVPKHVPWRVRQQMLEQEDRVKAQILRDKKKEEDEIAALEKELKIEEKKIS